MVKRRQQAIQVLPGVVPVPDQGETCLEIVAQQVSAATHQTVVVAPPRDSLLTWKSVSIHPMQSLETEYQGIVRDAARGARGPDQLKSAESAALGQFFAFDVGVPRLLGVGQGEPYAGLPFPLVDEQLREARRLEKSARQGIEAALAAPGPVPATAVEAALVNSWTLTTDLLGRFYAIPGSGQWRVSALDQARQALTGLDLAVRAATTWNQLQGCQRRLAVALAALETAVLGFASVQMIYFIESFYLFRLLIRFRIDAQTEVTGEETIEVSSGLTKIITRQPWIAAWLRDKLLDLNDRLRALDPGGNLLFFLKGGRAIKYLEGEPERGENDWDTQIVINPDLPPELWYALFRQVQNAVLLALQQYRLEFYTLLTHYAPDFLAALQPSPLDALDGDPVADAPPDPLAPPDLLQADPDPITTAMTAPYRATCKSELIDVGMPRYDTVEAREQWTQLQHGIVTAPDGMPFPGYLYYISEYITMLREVFAGDSPAPHKATKRIERLYKLLTPQGEQLQADLEAVVQHERSLIPPTLLPQSVQAADQQADPALRRVLLVLLQQFSAAYGLPLDPGFAAAFDSFFQQNLTNAATLGAPPQALADAIAAQPNWNPAYDGLVTTVGYCQWVSAQIEASLSARAAFLAAQKQVLGGLMQAVAGVFSFREEWEVELAVTGGFAAQLQADYTRYAHLDQMDPPFVLSAGLFAQNPQADPATIIELVQPVVENYLLQNPGLMTLAPNPAPGSLQVFWTNPVPSGPLTFAPLVFEIGVRTRADGWPQIAYIWGLPVLALRDLVKSYQRHTARIEEYGRRKRLRATTAALSEIYIRASNPEPANPVLAALAAGRAPYLKLSSQQYANGAAGDFPPAFFPAGAYELVLSGEPEAMGRQLTLPPPSPGVDRTLELLVLNQGHGDWQRFGTWTATALTANLVQPLAASGVRARVIVLDFCLSASLLDVFAPLCAPGGTILSSVYSITQLVMTPAVWSSLKPGLDARNAVAIAAGLQTRLEAIGRDVTGDAQMETVRSATWQAVAAHLRLFPYDRDALSIVRVLVPMVGVMNSSAGNLPTLYQELAVFRQRSLPWEAVGFGEQAILAQLPPTAGEMTQAIYAQMLAALRRRLIGILTEPEYRIGLPAGQVNTLPTFSATGPNLRALLMDHRAGLLALARGLRRCPTPFASLAADRRRLTLDAALLASPLDRRVASLLDILAPETAPEVPRMLRLLRDTGAVLSFDGVTNYDQS